MDACVPKHGYYIAFLSIHFLKPPQVLPCSFYPEFTNIYIEFNDLEYVGS